MSTRFSYHPLWTLVAVSLFSIGLACGARAQYFEDPDKFDLSGFPTEPSTFDEQRVMEEIHAVQSPRRTLSAAEKGRAHEMLGRYYEKRGDRQRAATELAKARYWYQGGQGGVSATGQTARNSNPPPGYSGEPVAPGAFAGNYPSSPSSMPSSAYPQAQVYPGAPSSGYPANPAGYPDASAGSYPSQQPPVDPAQNYPSPERPGTTMPGHSSPTPGHVPSNTGRYPVGAAQGNVSAEPPKKKKSSTLLRGIAELLDRSSE